MALPLRSLAQMCPTSGNLVSLALLSVLNFIVEPGPGSIRRGTALSCLKSRTTMTSRLWLVSVRHCMTMAACFASPTVPPPVVTLHFGICRVSNTFEKRPEPKSFRSLCVPGGLAHLVFHQGITPGGLSLASCTLGPCCFWLAPAMGSLRLPPRPKPVPYRLRTWPSAMNLPFALRGGSCSKQPLKLGAGGTICGNTVR